MEDQDLLNVLVTILSLSILIFELINSDVQFAGKKKIWFWGFFCPGRKLQPSTRPPLPTAAPVLLPQVTGTHGCHP